MFYHYEDHNEIINKYHKQPEQVTCGCAFCQGGKMRQDVKHYKIYSLGGEPTEEYYLNIEESTNTLEITKKL